MIENNNRAKAKALAEYITGSELRKYTAKKVHEYCGDSIETVFDGAIGSGQLEQFINSKKIFGVEIQQDSCDAALANYPNLTVECKSFFEFESEIMCDAVVMNPPFSIKHTDLTDVEKLAIAIKYPWKKNGVVDDVFMLKGLEHTRRYGFFIMFGGIAYRKTESQLRGLIGRNLLELNTIKSAFDDTAIDVLFLVIDKEKQSGEVLRQTYDCKSKIVTNYEALVLNDCFDWEVGRDAAVLEVVDILGLEREIKQMKNARRKLEDRLDAFIDATFKDKIEQESLF
jgi:predicted RNA methylase